MSSFVKVILFCGLLISLGCGNAEPEPSIAEELSKANEDQSSAEAFQPDQSSNAASDEQVSSAESSGQQPPVATVDIEPVDMGDAALLSFRYIPNNALAAILVRPAKALGNKTVQEIVKTIDDASPNNDGPSSAIKQFETATGVPVKDIDHFIVVFDAQMLQLAPYFIGSSETYDDLRNLDQEHTDRARPMHAELQTVAFQANGLNPADVARSFAPTIIIQLTENASAETLFASAPDGVTDVTVKGKAGKQMNGSTLVKLDEHLLLFGRLKQIEKLVDGTQSSSVGKALSEAAQNDVGIAIEVSSLQPILTAATRRLPMLGFVMPVISQIKTLILKADTESAELLQLIVNATSDDGANTLQSSLSSYLTMGRQQFNNLKPKIPASLQNFVQTLIDTAEVEKIHSTVNLTVPRPEQFTDLPTQLKPVLEKLATAEGETLEEFDLHQIGLAFHNFHDVYQKLPGPDSHGQLNGKGELAGKGLSWRVHLLPFLEELELYQQFELNEPWDSEHNKELINQMPEVYGKNPEGKTNLHAVVGERTMFVPESEGVSFRSVKDGLFSTILIVRTGDDKADIWTKPGGLEFQAEDPISMLGDVGETFQALMVDARVIRIDSNSEVSKLKNLFIRDDGNRVEF